MAQGMMAMDLARRSSSRMDSRRAAKRLPGSGAGAAGDEATGAVGICEFQEGAVRTASLVLFGGVFLDARARNKGFIRRRSGAVIFQERLPCSSVTNRRRLAASRAAPLAFEVSARISSV